MKLIIRFLFLVKTLPNIEIVNQLRSCFDITARASNHLRNFIGLEHISEFILYKLLSRHEFKELQRIHIKLADKLLRRLGRRDLIHNKQADWCHKIRLD